jgi:hypothetical protein
MTSRGVCRACFRGSLAQGPWSRPVLNIAGLFRLPFAGKIRHSSVIRNTMLAIMRLGQWRHYVPLSRHPRGLRGRFQTSYRSLRRHRRHFPISAAIDWSAHTPIQTPITENPFYPFAGCVFSCGCPCGEGALGVVARGHMQKTRHRCKKI